MNINLNATNLTPCAGFSAALVTGSAAIFGISGPQERFQYLKDCSTNNSPIQNIQNCSKALFGTTNFKTRAAFLAVAVTVGSVTYATSPASDVKATPHNKSQPIDLGDRFVNVSYECPSWCSSADTTAFVNIEMNPSFIDPKSVFKNEPTPVSFTNTSNEALSSERFCPSVTPARSLQATRNTTSPTTIDFSNLLNSPLVTNTPFGSQLNITNISPQQSKANQPLQLPKVNQPLQVLTDSAINIYVQRAQTAMIVAGFAATFVKKLRPSIVDGISLFMEEIRFYRDLFLGLGSI